MQLVLPVIIDKLDGIIGVTKAETTLDSHAKLTWEKEEEENINHRALISGLTKTTPENISNFSVTHTVAF